MITRLITPDGSRNYFLLQGNHGTLLLDEHEARELNGELPHELDPITDKSIPRYEDQAEPPERLG